MTEAEDRAKKAKHYAGRVVFIKHLLASDLSPKQRREAERDLTAAAVKHAMYSKALSSQP